MVATIITNSNTAKPMNQTKFARLSHNLICLLLLLSCCNCSYYADRIKSLGKAPDLEKLEVPMHKPQYQPVEWPKEAETIEAHNGNANSLWKPGARTFFRDQRARRVGDILKVSININDTANLANKTEQIRTNKQADSVNNALGLEKSLKGIFNKSFDPTKMVNLNNSDDVLGSGTVARKEAVQTEIAAMVTQILSNGNLVIRGHQEILVNFELRQVTIEGIVRPEDITSNNDISSDLIAEARITYGGRGNITNLQQPRIGNQIIDMISPF